MHQHCATAARHVQRSQRNTATVGLARAQQAGAVRPDLRIPELMAILTAVCMAAEHNQWDTGLRTATLAIVFDGLRPQHAPPGVL